MKRQWRELIAIAGGLAAFSPFLLLSKTFQGCLQTVPSYETYHHAKKGSSYFLFSLLAKFECLGPFIDLNANGIVALFTIVLTLSTAAMWWETRRLASGAEEQSLDTKKSIAVAEKAANAAEVSAKAAMGVELPSLHPVQINLTVAVPPPVPPDVSPATQEEAWNTWRRIVGGKVRLKNYGRSPAFVSSCVINLRVRNALPPIPAYEILDPYPKPVVIDGGSDAEFVERSAATLTPITDAEIAALKDGTAWIFIYGVVEYTDIWGNAHKSGFWGCRVSADSGFITLQGGYENYRYQS